MRASGLSQAITKFAFPTFTLLCHRLSPSSTSSITIALPLPRPASCKSHPHLFSPRLHPRRVFARYVNGTFSRRNKRALRSWRFTWNDFCRVSGGIVIGRIDILFLLGIDRSESPFPLRPCSLLVFPSAFFLPHSSCSFRVASSTSVFQIRLVPDCIYRARARNFTAERLDFGFTPHRVARYQVYFSSAHEEVLSFSKYILIPDALSFQRDSKKVKVSARKRGRNFVVATFEQFLNVVLISLESFMILMHFTLRHFTQDYFLF